jgi:uncharacterized protein (DUF1015 family)
LVPRISPFVGLHFDPARVGSIDLVTAPPYDVISEREHERYLAASPYNVIRLDLGDAVTRGDIAVGKDAATGRDPDRYERAAADLAAWRDEGVLRSSDGPAYFPYEMNFSLRSRPRRVRGLIGEVDLEDWGGDIVPHERTMPGPIEDRLRLMRALASNLSCIYAVFTQPNDRLADWLDSMTTDREPAAETTDEDGVEHRLWTADPDPVVAGWLESTPLMIADGHHRYETALRYRDEMRKGHGAGPWDRVMMFVVDATLERPPVLPFHRIQLNGDEPAAGRRVRNLEEVLETVDDAGLVYGIATHERGAVVHRVAELTGPPPAVSRLHEQVLDGLDGLLYTPDAVAAEETVRSGEAVAAYLLPPTDAATIRSVIDGGDRLPQKSTFFWPKPRTGLVIRPHDAEEHARASGRAR